MSTAPQEPCRCSRFGGKVAVITGSTAGIGFAIAQRLGQEGAKGVYPAPVARHRERSGSIAPTQCSV